MAANEHFMFAEETVWGTWVAPDKAYPVRTVGLTGSQPLMLPEETGQGRGQLPGAVGEVGAAGNLTGLLRPTTLPWLLRAPFTERAQAAAGAGFRNKLLIDDDIDADSFSIQKRYRSNLAESLRGNKISGFTVGARTREFATISIDWIGKDSAISGGTWADGSAAPAVIDPVPYAVDAEPFKFYQAELRLGGTAALTAGEIVITGGTARNDVDNLEMQFNFNMSGDAYGINLGDRTVQSIPEGRREITIRFDPNFDLSSNAFYTAWKNGAQATLEVFFQGPEYEVGHRYEMKFTFPWVVYSNGGLPELNATYGLKRHTVEGMAFVDPTIGYDVGLVIKSEDDLTT